MRNDFNMMKDLAIHTRLPPEQRQREIGRLIDYIHKYATLISSALLCHETLEVPLVLKKKSLSKNRFLGFNFNLVLKQR